MDLILLAASIGTTVSVSKRTLSMQSSRSMTTAVGLSLVIFSLSILEVVPSTWLGVMDRDTDGEFHSGYMTVTGAYWILLWAMCLWTVLILPTIIGGQANAKPGKAQHGIQHDETKKIGTWSLQPNPWWMRCTIKSLQLLWGFLFQVLLLPLYHLIRKQLKILKHNNRNEPILVLTHNGTTGSHERSSSQTSKITNYSLFSTSYIIGASTGVMTTFVVLRTAGSLVISQQGQSYNILSTLVSWHCAVGLMLSSILNGFGSVSLPHSCLAGFYLQPIHQAVLAQAEVELQSTIKALEFTRAELDEGIPITAVLANNRRKKASRKSFADCAHNEEGRKQGLQQDCNFLEMLVEELREDVAEMKHAHSLASQARTPLGQIKAYVGIIFSVVLLLRLYTSIISFIQMDDTTSTSSTRDPITAVLLWLTGHHYVNQPDFTTLSQGISLLLTVILSFSQFQTFLRTTESVHRRLLLLFRKCQCAQKRGTAPFHTIESNTTQGVSQISMHILAALTGCYCVSCVVLIKMNVPIEYRAGFSAAIGGTDFTIHSSALNLLFFVSAAVSATVLGLLFGIQRQNTKRHASIHLETIASLDVLDTC